MPVSQSRSTAKYLRPKEALLQKQEAIPSTSAVARALTGVTPGHIPEFMLATISRSEELDHYVLPNESTIQATWGYSREVLIMYVELSYMLYEDLERLPSVEELNTALHAGRIELPSEPIYNATTLTVYNSVAYKVACYYRGIRKATEGLNERQRLCIAAVTDYTSRATFHQKLARLGIETWEYNSWMNYPPFRNRVNKLSEKALTRSVALADVALAQGAVQGKLDFIKYADLRSGKFDPNLQVALDVKYVLTQVVEIIQRNITEPELLRKLGGELSLLAGAAGLNPGSSHRETEDEHLTLGLAPTQPVATNSTGADVYDGLTEEFTDDA